MPDMGGPWRYNNLSYSKHSKIDNTGVAVLTHVHPKLILKNYTLKKYLHNPTHAYKNKIKNWCNYEYIYYYIIIFLWLKEILHIVNWRSDNSSILLYNNNIMFMKIIKYSEHLC